MSFRRFSSEIEAIARHWFENPVQDISFSSRGDFSATASGAQPVSLPSGNIAFLKPRPGTSDRMEVLREKIVSDLAYILDLPCAPVVLLTADAANPASGPRMLSLSCLGSGRPFVDGGDGAKARAVPQLEALRVFWTWVGDTDHAGHSHNLFYERQGAAGTAVCSIDHAFSLCHDNGQEALASQASGGYGVATLEGAEKARETVITKILELPVQMIEHLVTRLGDLLTAEEQDRILRILAERRGHLRAFFC